MTSAPTVDECVSDWLNEFKLPKDQRVADGPIYGACHDHPDVHGRRF